MPFDITFQTSFNMIVSGASGTGKTTWVRNLLKLKNQLFSQPPKKVFYYYLSSQVGYDEMKNEGLVDEFFSASETFPTFDEVSNLVRPYKDRGGSVVIFDDLMTKVTTDFEQMFCNLSHHENCSIIFLTQMLYYDNKIYRTMALNAHYYVLMKNDRAKLQVSFLSRQVCPDNPGVIMKAYEKATNKPYGYLILDFRAQTPEEIKLRTDIFPHQFPAKVFIEKTRTK